MKKTFILFITLTLCLCASLSVSAKDAKAPSPPSLKSISFENATINEKFSSDVHDYTITLTNPEETPTLKSYELNGKAELFVIQEENNVKQQTGIIVTLSYESGTVVYNFEYTNANISQKSSNNLLKEVKCKYGEVYPALNENDTKYTLYIPSDLKTLNITAVTDDVSASCDLPSRLELNEGQEINLTSSVIASNGDIRQYTFEIKRLNKNLKQVKKAMSKPDFETLVTGELFYQKPEFIIAVISVLAAAVLFLIFFRFAKRLSPFLEHALP